MPVDLQQMLRPVHGDVVRLTPPPHLRGLLTRTIRGYAAGHPAYLVPRADGTVVLGATSREDGNLDVSAGGVHTLLRDAIRLVPVVARCHDGSSLPSFGDDASACRRFGIRQARRA